MASAGLDHDPDDGVVLITDVFRNISQVPVAEAGIANTPIHNSSGMYDYSEQGSSNYALEEDYYTDGYLYDDFTNSSASYNYEYGELNSVSNTQNQQKHHEGWDLFNMSSSNLDHSDLYILNGYRYDARANFLQGVVGNMFLVPLAFIVGLCIGVIIWLIFVFVRKVLIGLYRWVKSLLPQTSLSTIFCCCTGFSNYEPSSKCTKTKTIWYDDTKANIASCDEHKVNNHSDTEDVISDFQIDRSYKHKDKNSLDEKFVSKLKQEENNNNNNYNASESMAGRKVSNSTFFLSNGVSQGHQSHPMSGI